MKKELDNIVNDLNKAYKLKDSLKEIKSFKIDPIEEIISYALSLRIIKTTSDVLEISRKVPEEVSNLLAVMHDKKIQEIYNSESRSDPDYKYRGTYDSLAELNAKFGTDFNQRCIPNGVIIRGINNRC